MHDEYGVLCIFRLDVWSEVVPVIFDKDLFLSVLCGRPFEKEDIFLCWDRCCYSFVVVFSAFHCVVFVIM